MTPTLVFSCCEIFAKHLFWKTSAYGCFWTDITKWLIGTLFLDSRFQNHLDSVILQKYQLLSNQSFKHDSAYPVFISNPTLSFEPRFRFRVFIINGYYTKSKRLKSSKALKRRLPPLVTNGRSTEYKLIRTT